MTQFKGFKTKEEAVKFQKKERNGGGLLCYRESDIEPKGKNVNDYEMAVALGGLDDKTYPYCVQWNV